MCSTLVTISSKGDLPMLERVLAGEFDQYSEDDVSEALLRSACHGYVDCVMALLAHGADADCEDVDGDTPLMLAASNNHVGSSVSCLLGVLYCSLVIVSLRSEL